MPVKLMLREVLAVAIVSSAIYCLLTLWIPFSEGRDTGTYFLYWQGLFQSKPPYPLLMLFRTPFTPVFFGVAYEIMGKLGPQIALCSGYALISVGVYSILANYSRWIAFLGLVLVWVNLQWFEVYNSVASEGPQTMLVVCWAWTAFTAMARPSKALGAALGIITFLLVVNRPANQLLLPCCMLPLLGFLVASGGDVKWRDRWICALVATATALVSTVGYMSYNFVRNGQFCIARLGGAGIPFYRVFVEERLVRPENGPHSAELADLARRAVLTHKTFQLYGIDERTFFEFTTTRMFDALFRASVAERGWDNDFDLFRKTAWECINANPKEFWLAYIDGVYEMFSVRHKRLFRLSNSRERYKAFKAERERRYQEYTEQGLPVPSEGDLLVSTGWWLSAVPSEEKARSANQIWFSPDAWENERRELPDEQMEQLRKLSLKISPSWIQLAIGFLGTVVAFFRGRGDPRLLLLSAACMGVLLATWLGFLLRYYRFPFDPIFTVFFCYGCFVLLQLICDKIRLSPGRRPWSFA